MSNAECNAKLLADIANIELPPMKNEDFVFVVWEQAGEWGHIYPDQLRVTQYDSNTGMHRTILDLKHL